MSEQELRAYVFLNKALSPIQKGVQGAHALIDLVVSGNEIAKEWATKHKTVIFLDGGFHGLLNENFDTLNGFCSELELPCTKFVEDLETMNGMTTALAAVVPESVYGFDLEGYDFIHEKHYVVQWVLPEHNNEAEFCRFLKTFNLAT